MYKLTTNKEFIIRTKDSAWLPCDESNTDYQEYLAWKEKGNEPLPADEPASQPADE
jgi:hypothetical protein